MNLDTTLKVLQIVLGEAKTTNDCDITTSYADSTTSSFTLGNNNVKSNGTTVVTVVAAPGDSATQRQVKEVRLFNNDTVSHTVTLQLFDGTSTWIIGPGKQTVPASASFIYTPESVAGASGSGVVLVVSQAGPFLASSTITTSGTINNSITSLTANALLLGAGTAAVAPLGSLGTATTVLHGNASGPPTFGKVDLAADVSGLLPFANLGTLAASSLFGNSGTVGATGGNIAIGTNLSLTAGGTLNATGGTTTIAATSLFGNPGTVAAAGTNIAIGANLSLSALGTLSATGGSGVATIAAGSNIVITNPSGPTVTVAHGTIAASSLFGNAGTVAGNLAAIAIGANLTLSATGTLSASTGGAGISTLVAGSISSSAGLVALPNITIISAAPVFTTWLNQNGAVVTANTNGPLVISSTATPGVTSNNTVRFKAVPVGAFTLIANLTAMVISNANGPTVGLCLTDGTKLVTFDMVAARTFATGFTVNSWTNTTTFASTLAALQNYTSTPTSWLRIVFDGVSTYTFSYSIDGFTWLQILSTAVLPFTPTGIGVVLNTLNNAASGMFAGVNYWVGA